MLFRVKLIAHVSLTIFIFLFVGCPGDGNPTYEELIENVSNALSNGDRNALVDIEQRITDDYFEKDEGIKFLKTKVLLFSITGDYENAARILVKGRDLFPEDLEIIIALGLVEELRGHGGTVYFQDAAGRFKNIPNKQKTSADRMIEYYLLVLLNEHNTDYANEVYNSLNQEEKLFAKRYETATRSELLQQRPIGFVYTDPIYSRSPGKSDEQWWLNAESPESQ
ncbi:hypothetical protein [Spirochaeta dissipatitropha]